MVWSHSNAIQAAERVGLPVMTHIGVSGPTIEDVLSMMRPGDILTHCCTGHTMRIAKPGVGLIEAAKSAWNRGVIMDIGHGAGSFSFESAEAMLAAEQTGCHLFRHSSVGNSRSLL